MDQASPETTIDQPLGDDSPGIDARGEGPMRPSASDEVLFLGSSDGTFPHQLVSGVLASITDNDRFKELALGRIAADGRVFASYPELLGFLQSFIHGLIRDPDQLQVGDPFELHEALSRYRESVTETLDTYDTSTKPNPSAVFWPNPERDPESSIFNTMPYVENLGLISKETPIGSAGSCFAIELARSLQERGFNYVTTESEHEDARNGVFVDDYDPERPHMSFSANYGLLFNTPSFRQLAEKAFGLRHLPRILMPKELTTKGGSTLPVYKDPFRESVFYYSYEAYEANYEKHVAAVREAFLKCEYFVITPGLNECWEYAPDGSVLSRNPNRLDFYPLLCRRVLSVEENVQNLQWMIDIVRVHNPRFKVIISLSPVPFLATTRSRECHVVTANTHSKAVLRIAVEELVKANRDVFYFPSYELVTVCSESPWEADQRHVNRATVERVMQLFEAMFVH